MKIIQIGTALIMMLFILASAGCSRGVKTIDVETSADGLYIGFNEIASDYTPEQAAADGCMVIVADSDADGTGTLFAGESVFSDFRKACERGDTKMRAAYFSGSGISFNDLIYNDGKYYYIDSEQPGEISQFGKLRALEGRFGSPERDVTFYVLTDSDELTANDVYWYYLSSNIETRTKIPFVWLGFTTFLTDEKEEAVVTADIPDMSINAGAIEKPDDFSDYTDITPPSVKSAEIYKNPDTCDSVALINDEYFRVGIGFGGYGVCDITECDGYLIFTYSFGSGLHRSHVGVIELATGETVYTSDMFLNIDVMLDEAENGKLGIYRADVNAKDGFCALTLKRGEKLADLSLTDGKINLTYLSE